MKEFLESGTAGHFDFDKRILVHNYEDFKKTDWGKEQLDKYLDRWSRLGFLAELEGETMERVALAMEQLAVYLITEAVEKELTGPFETIGFPMVRRVIMGNVTINGKDNVLKDPNSFKFETFIKYCKQINVVDLEEKITAVVKPFFKIDTEAQACVLASDVIIDKFNGDERSCDKIIENYITKIKERHERTSSDNTDA
jgi:hypothetical protein